MIKNLRQKIEVLDSFHKTLDEQGDINAVGSKQDAKFIFQIKVMEFSKRDNTFLTSLHSRGYLVIRSYSRQKVYQNITIIRPVVINI